MWRTAANSNIQIIERFQNKTLRNILDAPWFVPNDIIRKDTNIPTVIEEINNYKQNYKNRLSIHPNTLATNLLQHSFMRSRLRKYKPLL